MMIDDYYYDGNGNHDGKEGNLDDYDNDHVSQ